MATLTIRQLDELEIERLRRLASENHRSLEAEMRQMIHTHLAEADKASERKAAFEWFLKIVPLDPGAHYPGSVEWIRRTREDSEHLIVADASLATKWLLKEPGSDQAKQVFARNERTMAAPDLPLVEVGSALVRAANTRRVGQAAAAALLDEWRLLWSSTVIEPHHLTGDLVSSAATIAMAVGHPLPDCIYLALAIGLHCPLATCDAKFKARAEALYPDVRLLAELV